MKGRFTRLIILVSIVVGSFANQIQQRANAQTGEPNVDPSPDGTQVIVTDVFGGGGGTPGTPGDSNGGGSNTGGTPPGGVSNPTLPTGPAPPQIPAGLPTQVDNNGNPIAGSGSPISIIRCVQVDTTVSSSGYAHYVMIYAGGSWIVNNIEIASTADCVAPPSTALVEPCAPTAVDGTGAITFDCDGDKNTGFAWRVKAKATSECPVNRVLRHPFPRALVSLDTQFLLQDDKWGTGGESGNWSSTVHIPDLVEDDGRPTGEGQYKELSIGVRSFRLDPGDKWFGTIVDRPLWKFIDDGRNSTRPFDQKGPVATFAWEASSYYQPVKGRAFDFDKDIPSNQFNLPAYPVNIRTECGHQWSMKWKYSAHDDYCDGATAGDDTACQKAGGTWRTRFKWEDKTHNWTSIDLKKYGLPDHWANIKVATGGGVFNKITYWDPPSGGIWVPVIEVQSVLVPRCVYTGACDIPRLPDDWKP